MERKVVLSKTAEKKLRKLFDFLTEEWCEKVKNEFIKKLDFSLFHHLGFLCCRELVNSCWVISKLATSHEEIRHKAQVS